MDRERWRIVKEVFAAALERDPQQQQSYLDQACAGDPSLRAEVDAMLASDKQAGSFIDAPVFPISADLVGDDRSETPIGRTIGRYMVLSKLGEGGMGEVYLAEDAALGRRVALKVLAPHVLVDRRSTERFIREARLASALDHPNICTIYEAGVADGTPFISMQHVEGDTIQRMVGGHSLPTARWLSIALQVADALRAAHAKGIVHRDLKSSNIMVTPSSGAKVLDFGVATMLDPADAPGIDTKLTKTGVTVGTPSYLSPEQARGMRVDHRSDIFSLGIVLYEMATGRLPFERRSAAEVMHAIINEPHQPAWTIRSDVPPKLAAVIDRALAKDPAGRYQSVDEILKELRQVAQTIGLIGTKSRDTASFPLVAMERDPGASWRRWPGRRSSVIAAAVLSVTILPVGLAVWRRPERTTLLAPQPSRAVASIAVLPFKPPGPGDRHEALEMGMADTLIFRLSSIKGLVVRPISAVRKYADLDQDAAAAGREQQVDAVLDSRIQMAGDKIRVTARLVSGGAGPPR